MQMLVIQNKFNMHLAIYKSEQEINNTLVTYKDVDIAQSRQFQHHLWGYHPRWVEDMSREISHSEQRCASC